MNCVKTIMRRSGWIFLGAVIFTAQSAPANTIITDPGPGVISNTAVNNTFGYDFTVGSSAIELTALGLWDENQDGFTNPHSVGLWDTSGNLIAKAFLVSGTVNPLEGQFRYATIIPIGVGPVILSAGITYVLGASYIGGDADRFIVNSGGDQATFDPAVSSGNVRFAMGGFTFPNSSVGAGSDVGPNAQFTLVSNGVPESGSTAVLLGMGVVCLGCAHWRLTPQRKTSKRKVRHRGQIFTFDIRLGG